MQSFSRSFLITTCLVANVACHSAQAPTTDSASAAGSGAGHNGHAGQNDTAVAGRSGSSAALDSSMPRDSAIDSGTAGSDATADAKPPGQDAALGGSPAIDSGQPDPTQPAKGSSMIIGVGSWGLRSRSPEGGPFIVCRNPSTGNDHTPDLLRDIGYGAGVFIAVGGDANAMVMRSLDGAHWQEDLHPKTGCTSACSDWMGGVAYLDGVWLAGGGNGAVMRSTDGGLTWTGVHSKPTPNPIRHMAAGSGRFVAGADHGSVFVTADKGETWTSFDLWTGHQAAEGMRVAYGAGTFIAWGSWYNSGTSKTEQSCFVSPDKGDHWQACDASVATSASFVHDGTRWIARAGNGYASSTDGVAWTQHAASGVPSELLFDGKTFYGRSGTTLSRGDTPETFKVMSGTKASDFRGWTIGIVLDENVPVMGVPECMDKG
jgi:hypothetical protein